MFGLGAVRDRTGSMETTYGLDPRWRRQATMYDGWAPMTFTASSVPSIHKSSSKISPSSGRLPFPTPFNNVALENALLPSLR